MICLFLSLAAASPLPSLDTPHRTDERSGDVAVVVGLEDYAFVADVPHAAHDATVMADVFVYTLGVPADRLFLLPTGGREQIEAALAQAGQLAGPGARVWFSFAGHGAADPTTGERLLLGDDVRADPSSFAARGVKVTDVQAWAAASGAEPMLILDTCYTGTGRDGTDLTGGARLAVPTYATPASTGVVWTAAASQQTSGPLPAARHGAFTYFVAGALRGWADGELSGAPDGEVDLDEAQAFVRRQLAAAQIRDQTPDLAGTTTRPLSAGSERMEAVHVAAPPMPTATVAAGPASVPRITPGEGVQLVQSARYETRYAPTKPVIVGGAVIASVGALVAGGTWARARFGTPLTEKAYGPVQTTNIVAGGVFLTGAGIAALGLLPSPQRPVVRVEEPSP